MKISHTVYVIVFIVTLNFFGIHSDGKMKSDKAQKIKLPPCRACKAFVESFNRGVERTAKFKFEGGDTAWEEKNLGSYSNSEVRFVEIQEKLCSEVVEGKDQCYQLLEQYDEALEIWWFKKQKAEPDLAKHLCIDNFEVCCPEFHYGSNCTPCNGFPDNICNKNGKCKGSGTRKGNGKCFCDNGYTGDYCDICADGFYNSYKDDKKILCTPCHKSCDGKCTKSGPEGCQKCKDGYLENKDRGCADVNECLMGKAPCTSTQFCVNTEGSYRCLDCHQSCLGCAGDGPDECINCAPGYTKKEKLCVNVEEEEKKSYISTIRYVTYLGLCVCTYIILQKNVTIAAIVGLCVAIYITLSEYVANYLLAHRNADLKDQLTQQLNKAFGGS
ncbi:cysteine-rich with EGF-like domain protein 2 isoform X1 [Euwallacea similis]|uniref:cysteine-rich with EGF-like domain protein 2 isoform X1 n=1 Tax=Euwallacea similis TaxID=1736056 RepID=UPI003450940E